MSEESHRKAADSPAGRRAETAKSIGEEVGDYARNASRMASKQFNHAQDMAVDAYDETEAAIRRNPLTAVASALGIGFLLGVVLVRR